jgi:hypothetical protein
MLRFHKCAPAPGPKYNLFFQNCSLVICLLHGLCSRSPRAPTLAVSRRWNSSVRVRRTLKDYLYFTMSGGDGESFQCRQSLAPSHASVPQGPSSTQVARPTCKSSPSLSLPTLAQITYSENVYIRTCISIHNYCEHIHVLSRTVECNHV